MNQRIAYRVAEAADVLGISRAKTYQLIAAGVLPSIRLGGCLRVPAKALQQCIDRQLAARTATSGDAV